MATTTTEADLYRTVHPRQLTVTFKYNGTSHFMNLGELLQGTRPYLLGSFKFKDEVHCLNDDGSVKKNIPSNFRSQTCNVRRVGQNGISCFNSAHTANIQALPSVDHGLIEDDVWYFLEAASLEENSTIMEFFENGLDEQFHYNDKQCAIFLSYRLDAGAVLPRNYECSFDNHPPGHHTIRRDNEDTFDAEFCKIYSFNYGLIRELVDMNWIFDGLKIKASAEPKEFHDSYDKDEWDFAVIVHEYFSFLTTEELVDDAARVLCVMSNANYSRGSCTDFDSGRSLMRLYDELWVHCNEQELILLQKLKRSLNSAVVDPNT